jgi:hypothetical protein
MDLWHPIFKLDTFLPNKTQGSPVIHFNIEGHDGHIYEFTGRSGTPSSPAAKRMHIDPSITRRFLSSLPIDDYRWINILGRTEARTHKYNQQTSSVYDLAIAALLSNELCIYRHPAINANNALVGKNNIGLCIVSHLQPRQSLEYKPQTITNRDAAHALFIEQGLNTEKVVEYLQKHNLVDAKDTASAYETVLNRLANQELQAYKIPVPTSAPPVSNSGGTTTAENVIHTIPLAPASHSQAAPSSTPTRRPEPTSLEECEQRLQEAKARLEKEGYQPKYTDEEQVENVKNNVVSNARFVVSFQPADSSDAYLSFPKTTEDGIKYISTWCTSFDQLENADSDPQLIADVLATEYNPRKDYVLHIIDRGENLDQFGKTTITPTWENMKVVSPLYISKDHSRKTIESTLNPDYQNEYAKNISAYRKTGQSEFNEASIKQFSKRFQKNDGEKFSARHNIRTALGANAEFTGNGMTQTREPTRNYGVVEALCLDRDPKPISGMKNLKSINLTNRKTV